MEFEDLDNVTIADLRKKGYKVSIFHVRNYGYADNPLYACDRYVDHADKRKAFPRGGFTFVKLLKNGKSKVGVSECSLKDNYCRRRGVKEALKRAITDTYLYDNPEYSAGLVVGLAAQTSAYALAGKFSVVREKVEPESDFVYGMSLLTSNKVRV